MTFSSHALSEHPTRRDEYFSGLQVPASASGPVKWWPFSVLPPPHVLLATLFPTMQDWEDKSLWDRFLSTVSVPSIFLLVITLPVVDTDACEDASSSTDEVEADTLSHGGPENTAPIISVVPAEAPTEVGWEAYRLSGSTGGGNRAISESGPRIAVDPSDHLTSGEPASKLPSVSNANNESQPWNRWLVCLQLFTGPLFATFILWANLRQDLEQPGRDLIRMVLYTLLVSLVLLGLLLATTTEHARPRLHYLLCFLGFVISVAWISTIAGEVVGVLKAFGLILSISEALLGLTIFAAGNSIGDLVADITVARLGYPVMALSACFGGPMLNILLGIGIGGVMMMIRQANRDKVKHPDRPMHYGPYKVQLGGTLLISSITLLVILFLLLVLVPMNKWILSRKIGWAVIALWTVSTVVSVIVEMTGIGGEPG